LGGETKLGTRLECLAGLSGRAGASSEVEFPREVSASSSRIVPPSISKEGVVINS
jgi:hypothetical protein